MQTSRNTLAAVIAAVVALAAALATGSATDASIATLEKTLGDTRVEVDEVRITKDGVACIEYRARGADGRQDLGHAVVHGDDVVRSPAGPDDDPQKFEKAWS